MIDPNLDPEVETQLRAFMASAADLSTATIQLDNLSLDDIVAPIQVDENYMTRLAAEPDASPQPRHYAAHVAAGYCRWAEIESRLTPNLPPEVLTLKSSPGFHWPWEISPPEPPRGHDQPTSSRPRATRAKSRPVTEAAARDSRAQRLARRLRRLPRLTKELACLALPEGILP